MIFFKKKSAEIAFCGLITRDQELEPETGSRKPGAMADDRPVLAPVELERFAGAEGQRHEGAEPGGLLDLVAARMPCARKGGHPVV